MVKNKIGLILLVVLIVVLYILPKLPFAQKTKIFQRSTAQTFTFDSCFEFALSQTVKNSYESISDYDKKKLGITDAQINSLDTSLITKETVSQLRCFNDDYLSEYEMKIVGNTGKEFYIRGRNTRPTPEEFRPRPPGTSHMGPYSHSYYCYKTNDDSFAYSKNDGTPTWFYVWDCPRMSTFHYKVFEYNK